MSKNITIIGVNYYPEDSAIGLYTTQKAEYLVSKGLNVTVITGCPYYPQWKIREDYSNTNQWSKETINNVNIYRYKQYVPQEPTFIKRILHLISFTLGSFFNLFKVPKPSVVICIVPFTTSILLGWFLKIRYKSKLWVHIQDFEFDAAIDSGLLNSKKKILIKPLLAIEKFLFKRADVISTISNGMLDKLFQKTKIKGQYLTNWLDISVFQKPILTNHNYLKSSKFKILYSGNIGAKQDWNFFFSFLNQIKEIENLEVVIVGEGAEQKRVINEIKKYPFVKHHNLVPFKDLPILLNSADLHILFQKDDVIDTVMPSKILGMMGSGKPSIITGNSQSEVKQIIEKSGGGFYFQNNNLHEIKKVILKLQEDKEFSKKLGENAKTFIINNYSKEIVLGEFLKSLNKTF